eukprot:scaffold3827_cov137-Isochrysis_galbana.AAC.2
MPGREHENATIPRAATGRPQMSLNSVGPRAAADHPLSTCRPRRATFPYLCPPLPPRRSPRG